MQTYESPENNFLFMYPADCLDPSFHLPDFDATFHVYCIGADFLGIGTWEISPLPISSGDADEYADILAGLWKGEGYSVWQSSITTHEGLKLELVWYGSVIDVDSKPVTLMTAAAFYVGENRSSVRIEITYRLEDSDAVDPIVEYILKSFTVLQ